MSKLKSYIIDSSNGQTMSHGKTNKFVTCCTIYWPNDTTTDLRKILHNSKNIFKAKYTYAWQSGFSKPQC